MNMPTGGMPGEMMGFFAVYVLFMIAGMVAGVISLVAMWRAMRAHESIAESMRRMASYPSAPGAPPLVGRPPTA